MGGGFDALSLALFTALSPAGGLAFFCLMAFYLAKPSLAPKDRVRVSRFAGISLAVAWAGFVASATHLGTPANALYVAWGVGRSPLSNEVAAAVAFLFFAGMFWLYSFKRKPAKLVASALGVASMAAALALILFSSLAYSVATVPSWDTWLTPVNLWLSALFAGPALAAFVLQAARCSANRWPWILLGCSAVFLAVGSLMLFAQVQFLEGVGNAVVNASDLVPHHELLIVVHVAVGALGLAVQARGMRVGISFVRGAAFSAAGCLLVFGAAILVRLPFYWSYLSVGF